MNVRNRSGRKVAESRFREMNISCFALDSVARMPMVLLKDEGDRNTLPIWFSGAEAVAIAAELINRDALADSGCRDLMTSLFGHLQVEIARIAIEGMRGAVLETFVYLDREGDEIRVKVRPCEAVAMALKHSLPIHVADEVLSRAAMPETEDSGEWGADDAGRFIELLESLDPKDMGRYPM